MEGQRLLKFYASVTIQREDRTGPGIGLRTLRIFTRMRPTCLRNFRPLILIRKSGLPGLADPYGTSGKVPQQGAMMKQALNDQALDLIFREARTYRRSADAWLDQPVDDALLHEAYDLAKLGPTSANCQPLRVVFVRSTEAREKLRAVLSDDNVAQTMAAPATAIVAADHAFPKHLPRLYKEADAVPWFAGKPEAIASTAFRNSSLQGA